MKPIGIGIIGCGNIAPAYFRGSQRFEILKLISCADLDMQRARDRAEEFACKAETVEALLANPDIDLVINLTIPTVHADVSLKALEAGKHVHSEKPLAVNLEDGRKILETANAKGLLVGCAPDTFLGAGLQTSRKLIDDGWIGRPVSGTAFMMSIGPERWHPNPGFFYQAGAGPLFDMGPYYMTALVHLLGPVKSVTAVVSKARDERMATCKEQFGRMLPVEVPTHYSGTLVFHSGAVVSVTISFDVHAHGHSPLEIYGTEGSLKVPDPNHFGNDVKMFTPNTGEWKTQNYSHGYKENMRSIGAADMAYAIRTGRPHRCSGELALHILEVMHAYEKASMTGHSVDMTTRPEQPQPLPLGLVEGLLDATCNKPEVAWSA